MQLLAKAAVFLFVDRVLLVELFHLYQPILLVFFGDTFREGVFYYRGGGMTGRHPPFDQDRKQVT